MTDTIVVNEGQTISLAFEWRDDAGALMDISGAVATVFDASNPAINDMILTAGSVGVVNAFLGSASVLLLGGGQVTNFRMKLTYGTGQVITTPPIWVRVQ